MLSQKDQTIAAREKATREKEATIQILKNDINRLNQDKKNDQQLINNLRQPSQTANFSILENEVRSLQQALNEANSKIIDVGTGSGCIAIALATKFTDTKIQAIDISKEAIEKIQPLLELSGNATNRLQGLKQFLEKSRIGLEGVEELTFVLEQLQALDFTTMSLSIDVTLARGLNYYTGCIFEVAPPEGVKMGSIGGGGRYDDLTSGFGMKNMSGVGISFGFDRIYLVLEELNLFPASVQNQTQVLFLNFGASTALQSNKLIAQLRKKGLRVEYYPDAAKMKKQLSYANQKSIPLVVLYGDDEMKREEVVLKQMQTGEQNAISLSDLSNKILAALI